MISIFDPKHQHYAVHKEWSDGCFADPNNPPVVEIAGDSGPWFATEPPHWDEDCNYRIKPRMVTPTAYLFARPN